MGSSVLLLMVRDAYANYVVQTAIDVVPEGNERHLLLEELKANEVQLVSEHYFKNISRCCHKTVPHQFVEHSPSNHRETIPSQNILWQSWVQSDEIFHRNLLAGTDDFLSVMPGASVPETI